MNGDGLLGPELPPTVAEPRLLALRLHGFKSFAERTTIEFGRGISAVVGPNGSGKSNLADALRWALGEQGRALRSRKAEDVIWAGSEKRAAQGMADVTLVIDNADGLLPVEFQVLELGRRLYRSGENDYLLNKSRVRLRDLVDLLDAAHLADNAFLFIGQGMVDQALALRPEERRPLFDEVAGVRRHERRRRHAEASLTESEANLARVEDILAELRPQARRLAAQAEQQASRETTADELASALLASMHARWFEAARRVASATEARDRERGAVDRLLSELAVAEGSASALARELAARTALERDRREAHDAAQASATEVRLREMRVAVGDRSARTRAAPFWRGALRCRGRARRRLVARSPPRSRPGTSTSRRRSRRRNASWRMRRPSWSSCVVRRRPAGRSWRPCGVPQPRDRPRSRPRNDGWPMSSGGSPKRASRRRTRRSGATGSTQRWRRHGRASRPPWTTSRRRRATTRRRGRRPAWRPRPGPPPTSGWPPRVPRWRPPGRG